MEQKINLKQLEKKSASAIFQTGLVEIGIALVLLVSSLAMIFDDYRYYIDILYLLPVAFMVLAVKYIAQPRMGIVKYGKKRVKRSRLMMISITLILVIMVSLTFFGTSNSMKELINPRWIVTGIIFFICIAVAFFLNFDRMYFYAFLMAGAFNLSEEIRESPGFISQGGYAYLFASMILLGIGFVFLVNFLKKNPLPEKELRYEK